MGYEYLWQNIRVKGGAYGCMSNFNRIGEGYFVSYRDPNLERTMEIYEGVADYLRTFTVSDFDMNKYQYNIDSFLESLGNIEDGNATVKIMKVIKKIMED